MPQVRENPYKTGQSTALLGFSSQSFIIFITFGIVLVAAIGFAIYFYLQYQRTQNQLDKSTQSNEQAALIEEVGKLIVLPNEQPSIATVSDINKLKAQSFFAHARNGDKVLIYSKAQEAILYDPIANKIVEVGPISLSQVTPTQAAGAVNTAIPMRVAVYNGTSTVGLASQIALELREKVPTIIITSKADASQTYSATVVVDLTGQFASQASLLAKTLGGKVGKLPIGETKPQNADLLVILGK